MTRAHFLIAAAAVCGICSIIFDQSAYQFEKRASSFQIEIDQFLEKERELKSLNSDNSNFVDHLGQIIYQSQSLFHFFRLEFVSAEADKSFNEAIVPCEAETLLKTQIIDTYKITKRYMALSGLSKFIEPSLFGNASKGLNLLEVQIQDPQCSGMNGEKYNYYLNVLRTIAENLDFVFESGQLSYQASLAASDLAFKKMEAERVVRFSLLAAISFNILSLVVLLAFFKTVSFRRLGGTK